MIRHGKRWEEADEDEDEEEEEAESNSHLSWINGPAEFDFADF